MSQSRTSSAIEVALNYASGFLIALAVWQWVAVPLFNIGTSAVQGVGVTCLFTGVSIVRSYIWRRIFNWYQHREKTDVLILQSGGKA